MTDALPPGCTLRRARKSDIWTIRRLVFSEKLDPTQLDWRQFWAIESEGEIIACAQLRSIDRVRELGSLVVVPSWRDRGLGSYLVRHLVEGTSEAIYLECMGYLAPFYARLGFVEIGWRSLPKPLKVKFGLGQFASRFLPIEVKIMQYIHRE
ncbi:GNAT family N-acetyltransferase [Oxynema sp. CENA135]|uniref:GNAT family N-acetyltransferase n=1 Tax=Oxynema sp. CENA135 TaxID=984206 RepID=UPI00190A4483|nr:GNAT family N-acetyltransferase [Oxynema sp. CENA135]